MSLSSWKIGTVIDTVDGKVLKRTVRYKFISEDDIEYVHKGKTYITSYKSLV